MELLPIIDGNEHNEVYNEDINHLIHRINGDILYLDPPYNARQYCTNYHMCLKLLQNMIILNYTENRD